jgi:hypothetical protein
MQGRANGKAFTLVALHLSMLSLKLQIPHWLRLMLSLTWMLLPPVAQRLALRLML